MQRVAAASLWAFSDQPGEGPDRATREHSRLLLDWCKSRGSVDVSFARNEAQLLFLLLRSQPRRAWHPRTCQSRTTNWFESTL